MAAIVFDLDDTLYPRVRHVYSGFGAVARAIARRFEPPVEAAYARLRLAHDQGFRGAELQYMCAAFGLNESLVRLEVAPRNAVMVGDDRVNDIEGARAVGVRAILLARGDRRSTTTARMPSCGN